MNPQFRPNVTLFDADGELIGDHLRQGTGMSTTYTDLEVWEEGGRPILEREIKEWGWTVVPLENRRAS